MSIRHKNVDGNYVCTMPGITFMLRGSTRDGNTLHVKINQFGVFFITKKEIRCVNSVVEIGDRDPIQCCATPRYLSTRQHIMNPLVMASFINENSTENDEDIWFSLKACDKVHDENSKYYGKVFCKFKIIYE